MTDANLSRDLGKGIGAEILIFAACLLMPLFGFAFTIFIPLPALFYRIKLGPRIGGLVPLISFLFIAIFSGSPSFDLIAFGGLLGLGWLMGDAMERRLPVETAVVKSCGIIIATATAIMIIVANSTGGGLMAAGEAFVSGNLEASFELYRNMGVNEDAIQAVMAEKDRIAYVLLRIMPAIFSSMLLITAWAVLIMARPLLLARGLPVPDYGSLNRWKPPDVLVWVAIAAGMTLFMGDLKIIGTNIVILLMPVYFFSGIGVISWFFEQKQLPVLMRVFFYTLIALQQFLLLLVISIGFFDIWFNFRTRGQPPEPPSDQPPGPPSDSSGGPTNGSSDQSSDRASEGSSEGPSERSSE